MSDSDQIYYRTAYSRGSMIQIGETVYPNLGFNALQRHPDSWISAALVAIDDSRIGVPIVKRETSSTNALMAWLKQESLWNRPALSFDLHWTMHSLSGEGSPIEFSVGNQTFGNDDIGTKFGEGQSLGFVLSKNFERNIWGHLRRLQAVPLRQTTDLPRSFALFGTKVFRLNDTITAPILSAITWINDAMFSTTKPTLASISIPSP